MFTTKHISRPPSSFVVVETIMPQLDAHGTFLSGPTLRHNRALRSVGKRQLARDIESMQTELTDRLEHIHTGLEHMRHRFPQLGDFASQITTSIAITRDALRPFDAPPTTQGLKLRKARLAAALRTTLCCSAQIAGAQVEELERRSAAVWGDE
jgi:hypothetical protein